MNRRALMSATTTAVVVVAAAAAATTACASTTPASSTHQTQTVLSGVILYAGGPPGQRPTPQPGHVSAKQNGKTIKTTDVPGGHRFRLRLAPGRYTLNATSGDARCIALSTTITTHHPATATITLQRQIALTESTRGRRTASSRPAGVRSAATAPWRRRERPRRADAPRRPLRRCRSDRRALSSAPAVGGLGVACWR